MLFQMKKSLALVAMLSVAALAGCSGNPKSGVPTGNAKVSVSTEWTQAQINHITMTISAGTVSSTNSAMTDIALELTKAPQANQWTAQLTNIPAGTARVFKAAAYQAAGTATTDLVYYGETVATVQAGKTATVTIILQEQNVTPGPTRYAPAISSLTVDNSYVLPSQAVTIHAAAVDPDHKGDPLSYAFSATCTGTGGNGSFSPATGAFNSDPTKPISTVFTAPTADTTCQIELAVKETSGAANSNAPINTYTYFTIVVNSAFGSANVAAFPNSYPIVTVAGNFYYNSDSAVTVMPVGQAAALNFQVVDPDGDNVQYDVAAQCGTSLTAAATQPVLSSDFFYFNNGTTLVGKNAVPSTNGATYTTTGSTVVSPPSAYTSQWQPKFGEYGVGAPGVTFTDPTQDCIFTVTVHDLCTAGNCGSAGQGGYPDGHFKTTTVAGNPVTSFTTGIINATHSVKALKAPVMETVVSPNQSQVAAVGVQSWDPQFMSLINPNQAYNLTAIADDRYASGTLAVAWSCNGGNVATVTGTNTTGSAQPGQVTSANVWTAPATLAPGLKCTATFTSSVTSLSTVATFEFVASDPCAANGWAAGHACSTGNACLTNESCNASGQCVNGTPKTCSVTDGQCQSAVCDTVLGCVTTNASNGTSCNKDSNGCTANDSCQAGACTAGAAVVCPTAAPDTQCQVAGTGVCNNTGANSYTCNYTALSNGTSCNADNNGCTIDSCQTGLCTAAAGGSQTCAQSSNPCQASTGTCNSLTASTFSCSFANLANNTACNTAGACITGQACQAGSCAGGTAACPAGQGCTVVAGSPQCKATIVAPQTALDIQITPPAGLAQDTAANSFIAGPFYSLTAVNFGGGFNLTSTGGADMYVAKYNSTGAIQWAVDIGDDDPVAGNDQIPVAVAATKSGALAVVGNFSGTMTFGTNVLSTASTNDFLVALDSTTNARLWGKQFNDGSAGAIAAVAANPNHASNRIAVCGKTNLAGANWTGGSLVGTYDAVIGVYDNAGNKLWAADLGSNVTAASYTSCTSVVVDDNGDVFATGQFDAGTLNFPTGGTPIALTGPNRAGAQKWIWVAKFAGAGDGTGHVKTLAAVAYSVGAGQASPTSLAVDAADDVIIGGLFTSSLNIGALMNSAGGNDGFVAKLDGTALAPVWNALRIGGTGADQVNGVSVTSYGDIVVTGSYAASTAAFKTANGGKDTNGIAQLANAGGSDAFVLKLNGGTGALDFASGYGDAASQNGDRAAVNRYGANEISLAGTFGGTIVFPSPAGSINAAGGGDVYLVTAKLQ